MPPPATPRPAPPGAGQVSLDVAHTARPHDYTIRGSPDRARVCAGHCPCASQPRGFKRVRAWALAAPTAIS
eukprot:8378030-Alexandrium_andersonii.AAC.1